MMIVVRGVVGEMCFTYMGMIIGFANRMSVVMITIMLVIQTMGMQTHPLCAQ